MEQPSQAVVGPLERTVRPHCSHCRFPLPASDSGLRHYGTHTAHQENECLRLLHAEIERLTGVVKKVNDQAEHFERLWYLAKKDADRYAFAKTLEGQVVTMEAFKVRGAAELDQALDDAMAEAGDKDCRRRAVDIRTLATHREISDAVHGLEKERREAMRELMRDFDEGYYRPNMKDAREACARIDHAWRFTHLGPLGDPWFCCGVCHATECRPERESALGPNARLSGPQRPAQEVEDGTE